jgi:Holliday junction resolvase-like predicted endonuclease
MQNSHYLIQRVLPYTKPIIIKIGTPANIVHIKKIISLLVGDVYVYLYNEEDNSRQDLTDKLGCREFDIHSIRFDKISKVSIKLISISYSEKFFKFYSYKDDMEIGDKISKIFMYGHFFKRSKYITFESTNLFCCSLDAHYKNKKSGESYEKFIANKYKSKDYSTILNGISKKFNDGGIDVIATKNNTITLIQCKNWSLSNGYKINQKDLRAFVGDCYIYLQGIDYTKKKIAFHYIVSHSDILTKSAQIFLDKNSFIKFKVVPFEKE